LESGDLLTTLGSSAAYSGWISELRVLLPYRSESSLCRLWKKENPYL
jgi:hypothetical protein